ncbi:MAG: alpha-D-ribose 1-methylphosphonate 5-triphosphate diphosphatase [Thermodesulfobacteriota bacterium]|nr:alpha-D-ribose 1-methylphosphonate 5-triphosphate diphosphatase [Thermodesulfobacteriota bacterium]
MEKTICLYGGSIFNGERLYPKGGVLFSEKGIIRIIEGGDMPPAEDSFNVHGQLIAPGLVDLHSDALEKCIEIRPGVYFDAEFALLNLDRRLAFCGITSFCHAISFAEDEFGLRSCEKAETLVRLIHKFNKSDKAQVNHLIHARFEISNPEGESVLTRLIGEDLVDMVSIMDHTPGQGQFKTLESYIAYHTGTYKVTPEQVSALVEQKTARKEETMKQVVRVGQLVRESNIPFLSHDDDTAEKVSFVRELGVNASEFPVSMEAAQAAKKSNIKVFMGAPNLIRGCSSNNHLKASDALKAGMCDALVSDYYPECLLQAPFTASKRHNINLQETLKLVTSNPGDYLKQRIKAGRLIEGAPADLIIVDHTGSWVRTAQTWVSGRCVYNSNV